MPIERFRLSQKSKDQLIKLKRWTGVQHWNVLCRWAFCASLAEPTLPPAVREPADSSVELDWKTFGGAYDELYMALLRERCLADGLGTSDEVLSAQFRFHLQRGIGILASDRRLSERGGLLNRLIFEHPAPSAREGGSQVEGDWNGMSQPSRRSEAAAP